MLHSISRSEILQSPSYFCPYVRRTVPSCPAQRLGSDALLTAMSSYRCRTPTWLKSPTEERTTSFENIASDPVWNESGFIGLLRTPASPMSAKHGSPGRGMPVMLHWKKTGWVMPNSTISTKTGMATISLTKWLLSVSSGCPSRWRRWRRSMTSNWHREVLSICPSRLALVSIWINRS